MDFETPMTPLEGVEMVTKGRPLSIIPYDVRLAKTLSVVEELPTPSTSSKVETPMSPPEEIISISRPMSLPISLPARPLSEITEIYSESDSEFDEENEVLNNEIIYVEESAKLAEYEEEKRTSQTSDSTYDEIQTPRSIMRYPFVEMRKSVEGPRGPHLFRLSTASSDLTTPVLQLSPIHNVLADFPRPNFQHNQHNQHIGGIDQALTCETPMTAITETAYIVPHLGKSWQSEDPRTWTAQQVTIWMQDSGMESEVIDLFAVNDINGSVLMDLQAQDLKELGIQSFGKRHQVWNHIAALKEGQVKKNRTSNHSDDCDEYDEHEHEHDASGNLIRRRRKYRQNGFEPITPADSVSIVAIEQLLPRPHRCQKGDACEKTRRQKRVLQRLEEEHSAMPVSPGAGGRIFMVGNPGNATTAKNLRQFQDGQTTDIDPSVVGPSVVASSDILGPGELPQFTLDPEKLHGLEQRDPQDNVRTFLALQSFDPPQALPPPFDPEHPDDIQVDNSPIYQPPTPSNPGSLNNLTLLPRLQIPTSSNSPPQCLQQMVLPPPPASVPPPSHEVDLSTMHINPADRLYRYGTPASDMDVPLQPNLGPVARETSQSVPPNMQFRDQVQQQAPPAPRVNDWRRPSFQLPSLAEGQVFQPTGTKPTSARSSVSSMQQANSVSTGDASTQPTTQATSIGSNGSWRASTDSLVSNSSSNVDHRYVSTGSNVVHSGWMKKRKTKLLKHEWHERHFRLTDHAQLSMHRNDLAASSPLDVLHIDDYIVACSSVASGNKLAARLKALRLNGHATQKEGANTEGESKDATKDTSTHAKDAAFSFQLVPAKKGDESAAGKLKKATTTDTKKTHHFAVKTRDERIDWMRELMLAKALREKQESGHEVTVTRVENKSTQPTPQQTHEQEQKQ